MPQRQPCRNGPRVAHKLVGASRRLTVLIVCQDTADALNFHAESQRRHTLTRKIISFAAAAALAITPHATIAVAQSPETLRPQQAARGPTVAANRVGIRVESAKRTTLSPAPDAHVGAGKNVAMMVVGGAALIIGAVIGGAPGVIIAVAGAAIGLYGLYNFIQ